MTNSRTRGSAALRRGYSPPSHGSAAVPPPGAPFEAFGEAFAGALDFVAAGFAGGGGAEAGSAFFASVAGCGLPLVRSAGTPASVSSFESTSAKVRF